FYKKNSPVFIISAASLPAPPKRTDKPSLMGTSAEPTNKPAIIARTINKNKMVSWNITRAFKE
ncbi:MAG TPA: hypothetical protein VHP30_07100, partial [Ignavibacteriales bacterium]|nr:hypothetical protein [Ignavibacteriales bacterium]